ncbi:unnamed protein product, partial [Hapterophycus canaliculatus]
WINLWWPAKVAEDIVSEGYIFETGASDIGALVFVGNLALVAGTLIGIFLLHVVMVSGMEALWLTKKRARDNLAAARRRAEPVGELQARFRGGNLIRRTTPEVVTRSPFASHSSHASQASGNLSPVGEEPHTSDEEEGGGGLLTMRTDSQLDPVATCRQHSTSAWLHFPHVELVFLFFAFEGAVASFASVMRHSECPELFSTAAIAMVLYPLLMFVSVFRTLLVRVRPNTLLVFKPFDNDNGTVPNSRGGVLSRIKSSWVEDLSLFSWADKGQWETVQTPNRLVRRDGDWFRIGFEPVFVDFTKRGSWFIVISLVSWASFALVGVLVDSSVVQLLLFCGLHSVLFFILVFLKPFANSVINNMEAFVLAIDAICMGLLATAALRWESTDRGSHVNTAVVVLQMFALCALAIPVCLDAVTIAMGAIRSCVRKAFNKTDQEVNGEEQEARAYIRSYIRRKWCRMWCAMLRHNIFACAKDTREGIRKPQFSTAARSGPYPPLDSSSRSVGEEDGSGPPRRPSHDAIGTISTPVFVLSDRLQVAGSRATVWGGIPTPARRSPARDLNASTSFNDLNAVEVDASGKVLIQQGVDSSDRYAVFPAIIPAVFNSADTSSTFSFNDTAAVDGTDIAGARAVVQEAADLSDHDTDPRDASSGDFDYADRHAVALLDRVRAVEGEGSGIGVMQYGLDWSGRDIDPPAAPCPVFSSADRPAAPSPVFNSADRSSAYSFPSIVAMEVGPSVRRVIHRGYHSSWEDEDLVALPAGSSLGSTSVDGSDDFRDSERASIAPVSEFDSSGACSAQSSAGGTRPMTGGGVGVADRLSATESVALPRSSPSVSSSVLCSPASSADADESTSDPATGCSSGRKIIRHGDSNEHEVDVALLAEESGLDRYYVFEGSREDGKYADEPTMGSLGSRASVDSDISRRCDIHCLAAATVAAASHSSASHSSVSLSSMSLFDSGENTCDEELSGERGAHELKCNIREGKTSGSFRLVSGKIDPNVPSGRPAGRCEPVDAANAAAFKDTSGSSTESDSPRGESRGEGRHSQEQSGKGLGRVFSRLALGGRNVPTESTLPRRRSVHAPTSGLPVDDPGVSTRQENRDLDIQGAGRGDAGGTRDIDVAQDDLTELNASARRVGGPRDWSRRRGAGGWGVKSRTPVASDAPRRNSSYSTKTSGRSMGCGDAARGLALLQQDRSVSDDGGSGVVVDDSKGGSAEQGFDGERRGSTRLEMRSNSVLAGLAFHRRRPVESGSPRRRLPPETSLSEGKVRVLVEGPPSCDNDGMGSPSSDVAEDVIGSAAEASRRRSSGISGKGGWWDGLKSRAPAAIDLPHRSSGYGATEILEDESSRPDHGNAVTGAEKVRRDTDDKIDPVREGSESNSGASNRRKGLFLKLPKDQRNPIESNLPQRRPKYVITDAVILAPIDPTAADGAEKNEPGTFEAAKESGNSISSDSGRLGKSCRWGLGGRHPIASNNPQRSSVLLSGTSQAATVV